MFIDLIEARNKKYIRELEDQKKLQREEIKYFIKELFAATGIFLMLIMLYFIGFIFL